jgi:TonB family protein
LTDIIKGLIKCYWLFCLLLATLSAADLCAQSKNFEKQLHADILSVESFSKTDLKSNQFYLESPFAKGSINPSRSFDSVINQVIYRIDLVYTTYKLSPLFNQQELNKERLIALQKIAPQLFKNHLITWGQIAITGAQNVDQGQQMFHGFIFTYRVNDTKTSRNDELLYLKQIMGDTILPTTKALGKSSKKIPVYKKRKYDNVSVPQFIDGVDALNDYLKNKLKYPAESYRNKKEGSVVLTVTVNTRGELSNTKVISGIDAACNDAAFDAIEKMPPWIPAKRNGRPTQFQMTLTLHFNLDTKVALVDKYKADSTFFDYNPRGKFDETYIDSIEATDAYFKLLAEQDSSVLKVLARNKWQSLIFVCDVTGSMSAYTSQMLIWFKQPSMKKRVKYFYFFNDGNNIADSKKRLGLTGGVYPVSNVDFNEVTKTVYQAMMNGDGGDVPENNVEAVLAACQKFDDGEIAMIADNFATPRDLELAEKICRPIHVLLCGTFGGINTNYMDLVRLNKGTLHTITSDIINLNHYTNGQELVIDEHIYKLINDKFEMIK